ncbi:hypothetical protein [Leptothoe spongobia]|uniref:Uncharacterized protein n=1 Tax=Leptothoe spongobia TAU-MAC 1115 TaxID=1967444 RepID=A0A947GJU3_9CYAN|nr:hypothetical protein [Leptothoe spongobia]MBT9316273.1 hypothetical protein [Leptothoe spongobia TAU-MAC 1115]
MRLPDTDTSLFVDGNPDGGTIVRAAFMNAVLGELLAILGIANLEPLETGDEPGDHSQIAAILQSRFLQQLTSTDYPESAITNQVLIDPSLVDQGEYPFRIFRNNAWEQAETPFVTTEQPGEENDSFADTDHGQRGGGNLHALATSQVAGFMAPEAVQAINSLLQTAPSVYRSNWIDTAANEIKSFTHGLGAAPDQLSIQFRANETSPARQVTFFVNELNRTTGAIAYDIGETVVRISTGDFLWSGSTDSGIQRFSTGQIRLIAILYGG